MSWRATLLLTILTTASALPAAAQAQTRPKSDQEILMALEHDWDKAYHSRDIKFIDNILAREFVTTYAEGGRADRTKELELAAAFNQQIDSSVLDDFIIKVYGDTAVVHFTQHLSGPSKGKTLELTFRYLDVFVMRDGRWQCVASQNTKVTG